MADACADPRDAVLLGALGGALMTARQGGDRRDPLAVLTEAVSALTGRVTTSQSGIVTPADRDAWLRRLRGAQRSDSTIRAYRDTIDDLLAWARRTGRGEALFEESTIVDYLDEYRSRCDPAPATYHRRFLLLRRFMQWLIRRDGLPDPFAELQAPPKPHQEADWLTPEEFAQVLDAAARPRRHRQGIVERDRLVLLGLVTMALRRSELIALNWGDLTLDGTSPSAPVRRGKGGKPRRQRSPPRWPPNFRGYTKPTHPRRAILSSAD